jgi:16S rRNA (cytosine967-C5)-methyltransferase
MRLGGRISAAIDVLTDIQTRHRPASEALRDWGTSHRFAGSADRGVIGNIVYDALRVRASSAWIMGDESPRAVALATVARRWGIDAEALAAALLADPHAPQALSEDEKRRLREADPGGAPPEVRADIPAWTAPRFERTFGGEWIEEGAGFAERPPLDMRANNLKADRAKVLKALARFGAAETPFAPHAARIRPTTGDERHPNVEAEAAFQKGWFEVQDEGSQVAAALTGAKPGMQVLDLCAGAGGKTLALAAAMGGKGRIVATDRDRSRLAPIYDRVRRAAAHNVEVRAPGASLDDIEARMEIVLVDAPCTGSGTWRRRPDAKWRLTERALGSRIEEQAAILAEARKHVKPGGRLVYVTCSVLPEENEDQMTAFVTEHPQFAAVPSTEAIAAAEVNQKLAAAALLARTGVILTPRRTNTDGFFISVLQRQ